MTTFKQLLAESSAYDSREETKKHIRRVQELISEFVKSLRYQVKFHDASKLEDPEKHAFDVTTPKLKNVTYGSEEYKSLLAEIKPALDHHYAANSHHPEHYPDGVSGMDLLDIVEMFCDWKAASERHADGDFEKSIAHNAERFSLDPQLASIFENTRKLLGW